VARIRAGLDGVTSTPSGTSRAIVSPSPTVTPSSATISSTPAASASYSIVALSVSISTTGSPATTVSPPARSQRTIVPSSIESDRRGIVISVIVAALMTRAP
jgi:hypothetical protein